MIQNENQLTSLPFYTALRHQDRLKWWVQSLYRMRSPNDRFLPFQICKPITALGGATCPLPASIDYTADFSTTVDGWYLDDFMSLGATLSINAGRLQIALPSGVFGRGITIRKKLSTTRYAYNNTETVVNLDSVNPVKMQGYTIINCAEFEGNAGPDISSGYTITETCAGDTENDIMAFTFSAETPSAVTIFIEDFTVSAVPYKLFLDETAYDSDFAASIDGWSIVTSGSAALSFVGSELVLTYNSDYVVYLEREVSYTNDQIDTLSILVEASTGGILSQWGYEGLRDGDPVYRSINITPVHDLSTGDFEQTRSNSDNIDAITKIFLVLQPNGVAATNLSDIIYSTVVTCVESQADLWTEAGLVEVKTGTETSVLTYMNANTEVVNFADYQVAIYKGGVALAAELTPDDYYLRLNDGTNEYFSEVFNPCASLDELIKIEWWRDIDLVYTEGRIVYSTGYINTMYLEGDIGKPTHEYDIEQTVRNLAKFKQKIGSVKKFGIKNLLLPEPIIDVLSRIPHHEYVTLLNQAVTYTVTDIVIPEPEWEEEGDLAQLDIEFETDNIITSGTSVAQNFNQLLGDPTDAINIRGNNKRIYQLSDTLDESGLYIAGDKDSLTEAVRIPLTYFSQLASAESLPLSTSLYYGGELSINSGDNSLFDIAAGRCVFIDNYTDPEIPAAIFVEWGTQLGLSVTNIATQLITYIAVDVNGDFVQRDATATPEESREFVELGVLVHTDLATIEAANTLPNWNRDADLKILDLSSALGSRLNIEGNTYSPNGANLSIDKSAGVTYGLGSNYEVNKKSPNFITSSGATALTFLTAYGGAPSNIGSSTVIDTANYDPNGAGVLTPLPTSSITTHGIFFSPDTGLTIVHYGQYLYDSLREAVDSWEKEEYTVIPELEGVGLLGVLAFVAGATDLSDPMQAKFIKPGKFGLGTNATVPEYSRYASIDRALAGMTYKRPGITLIESAGTIYAEVERLGGGNLIFIFGEREYILDCTTGTGTDGKARIALTAGTATAPQTNYIYATPTTGNGHAVLNASTSYPTGEYAFIADCALQDSVSFLANAAMGVRRWTDAKEFDGRSSMARTNEWIRRQPATWESGAVQTVTINTVPSPDSVVFSSTAAVVWQKHRQNFPALNISVSGIYIVNHPTTPYLKIFDLNSASALITSAGASMSGTRFNWVIWGIANKSTSECKLFLNLPTGISATDQLAVDDPNNKAVVTVPEWARGKAFLIARLPMRHTTPGGGAYENLALSINGTAVIDLRGQAANVAGGAAAPVLGSSFEDALFNIYNVLAGFQFRFDAANLTANRILTVPNSAGTLALLGLAQSFTVLQSFNAGARVDPNQTFQLANGLTFGDGDTGFWESTDDNLVFSRLGSAIFSLDSQGFNSINPSGAGLFIASTTSTIPTLVPRRDDINTGIGSPVADKLSIIAGGVECARIEIGVQKFYGQAVGGSQIVAFSATPNFDFDNGNTQQITLTANITSWTISNALPAGSYVIYFVQNGTGGWTIPDPTGIDHADTSLGWATTANDINIVNIIVMPDGTTIMDLVKNIVV